MSIIGRDLSFSSEFRGKLKLELTKKGPLYVDMRAFHIA